MLLEAIIDITISIFVMGVASRLCGAWVAYYKTGVPEILGRIIFWGGGNFLVARINHMEELSALAFLPMGITCVMIPPFSRLVATRLCIVVINSFKLILLSLISFIPMMLILWLHGYAWIFMLVAAFIMPMSYWIGRFTSSSIYQLAQGPQLMEFVVGNTIGLCLSAAIICKINSIDPLTRLMHFFTRYFGS